MVSVEKLLKGFEPEEPKQALLDTLIDTSHHLQGISKTIKPDEDSRNGFIALLLNINGFIAKDQTRWGSSASGKSAGEVDIKIESPDHKALSIIEAFNLKHLNRASIDLHLTKIFGYDASGLKENFVIVYSEAAAFSGLWQKYLEYIPQIDFEHPLAADPEELKSGFANIKLAKATHTREKEETHVYHVFVNMKV